MLGYSAALQEEKVAMADEQRLAGELFDAMLPIRVACFRLHPSKTAAKDGSRRLSQAVIL